MIFGAYIFLGHGDYHHPENTDMTWSNNWLLDDWKCFIDSLAEGGASILMLYMNGHYLPYASKKFPELSDKAHPNVQDDFLLEVLEYAKQKRFHVVAVITTSGHAAGFLQRNPHLGIEVKHWFDDDEDSLVSFPEHLREGKTQKSAGKAQLGWGVLCHNKPGVKNFVRDLVSDVLLHFGNTIDGVALHPPEAIHYCSCRYCNEINLDKFFECSIKSPADNRMKFICSYLEFQNEHILPLAIGKKQYIFTIPWLFEKNMEHVLTIIPRHITLIDWDYNLSEKRVAGIASRVMNYKKFGHNIWFMPTGGFSFDQRETEGNQLASLKKQLQNVHNAGVEAFAIFLGPKLSEHFSLVSEQIRSLINE